MPCRNRALTVSSLLAGVVLVLHGAAPVQAQSRVTITLSATRVSGGQAVTARLAIATAAPVGGVAVALTSDTRAITFVDPASLAPVTSVVIAAGQTRRDVSVRTFAVPAVVTVNLTASTNAGSSTASLSLMPPVPRTVTLASDSVVGGTNVSFTVTLDGPAPDGGLAIPLTVTGPASPPPTLTVPAGQRSASGSIGLTPVRDAGDMVLAAGAVRDTLLVLPPTVASIQAPASITGGQPIDVSVALTGRAPATGMPVALSSNGGGVDVRPLLTVAPGAATGRISLATQSVTTSTSVTLGAQVQGAKASPVPATTRIALTPPAVVQVAFSPSSVAGVATVNAVVTLNAPAPAPGMPLTWQRASPTAGIELTTPAALVVPAGQRSLTVPLSVRAAATASGRETITATAAGGGASGALLVDSLRVTSMTVDRSNVIGGEAVTVAVTRNGVPLDPTATTGIGVSFPSTYCTGMWVNSCNSGSHVHPYALGSAITTSVVVPLPSFRPSDGRTVTLRPMGQQTPSVAVVVTPLAVARLDVLRTNGASMMSASDSLASGEQVQLKAHFNARAASGTADAYRQRVLWEGAGTSMSSTGQTTTVPVGDSVANWTRWVPVVTQPTRVTWWTVFDANGALHDTEQSRWIRPVVVTLTVNGTTVTGGQTIGIGASIGVNPQALPAGGLTIPVEVSNPAAAAPPKPLTFAPGVTNGGFALTTLPVTAPTNVTVKVGGTPGNFSTGSRVTLTVVP